MKLLSHEALAAVAGGESMYFTCRISVDGFSDECLSKLVHILENAKAQSMSEDEALARYSTQCPMSVLSLISQPGDEAPIMNVSYR